MRVAIIHQNVQADTSLAEQDTMQQARQITKALTELGHEVFTVVWELNLEKLISVFNEIKVDCVFNVVESFLGRDSNKLIVPMVLDQLKIPYTGSGLRALYLDNDKMSSKIMMHQAGIPTPDWWDERGGEEPQGTYIVKSVSEDCSLGLDQGSIVTVTNKEQLLAKFTEKKKNFGGQWFAERYIDGRDFNLSILVVNGQVRFLPPAEIVFTDPEKKIYDFEAKWGKKNGNTEEVKHIFAKREDNLQLFEGLEKIAWRCWKLFELDNYARIDFRVDRAGNIFVLEFNANPCLEEEEGNLVVAAREAGISYKELISIILNNACESKKNPRFDENKIIYS